MKSNEILLRRTIKSQLTYPSYTRSLNEAMLHEGLSGDIVRDAIQFVVGAGAEYGLGTLALPAAGAGLAVGPTVETMVDALFGAEAVAGAVQGVTEISSQLKEFGDLWSEARSSYSGSNLKAYYDALVKIVHKALSVLGEKAEDGIEELADKLRGAIEKIISNIIKALKAGIKLIVPDATLGLAAAKAFEEGLMSLAENAFDILAGGISKIDLLKDFVDDPSIAVKFFRDVFKQVIELMRTGAESLKI